VRLSLWRAAIGFRIATAAPTSSRAGILDGMANQLSAIPPAKRKQLAATLGLFAVLFVTIGAVSATGPGTAIIRVFVWGSFAVAVLLALIAWGVASSVRLDAAEERLDAEIARTIAEHDLTCGCGTNHDVNGGTSATAGVAGGGETHVCSQDGACGGDCSGCALAALRPSPTAKRSERLSR